MKISNQIFRLCILLYTLNCNSMHYFIKIKLIKVMKNLQMQIKLIQISYYKYKSMQQQKNKIKSTNKQANTSKQTKNAQPQQKKTNKNHNIPNTNGKKVKQSEIIPLTEQQIKQQQQINQALQRLSKLQQVSQETSNKKSSLLLLDVTKSIQSDIIKSIVQIPEQAHELTRYFTKKKDKQKQKNPVSNDEVLVKQYESLTYRKQAMHKKLQQLQDQQLQLKKSMSNSKLVSSPNHKHNKMPELTEDVKRHWIKIKQIVKQHEQQSKKYHQQSQKKSQQERQIQLQLVERRNKQKSQQKRKVLQAKIQQIQKRHSERTAHIKEEQTIIQRLKNKKKLFERMQQNWHNKQKQHQLQHQALMLERYLKNKQVNMRQLKIYQQQHDQRYSQQQQNRKRRMSQSKISSSVNIFTKSRVVDVLQQDRKNKALQLQKINQIKQLIDKRKQYATTIKQKYRSSSKLDKKIQKPLQIKSLKQMRSMSAFDIKSKGNQYMRAINSSVANLKLKQVQNRKQQKSEFNQSVKQYKNYLKELRMNRTANNDSQSSNKEMDLIQTIMKKPNASTQQKFFQAQIVTSRMESKGTSKNLLNSINAKMQILKKLSYN